MNKIPFSVYDFFAYLSSGTVLLTAVDYVGHHGLLAQKEAGPALLVVLTTAAYVLGQVVAHFSSFVLEHVIVGRVLGRPMDVLLEHGRQSTLLRKIFPNYYRALPRHTQSRVREQAILRACPDATGEALFLHVYATVTSCSENAQARVDDFRNQYGFARNMALAFISASVAIAMVQYLSGGLQQRWAYLCAAVAVAMFYRYLKFFRQFSYELLLRYAELEITPKSRKAGA
jgi:hypothetical protein